MVAVATWGVLVSEATPCMRSHFAPRLNCVGPADLQGSSGRYVVMEDQEEEREMVVMVVVAVWEEV